MIQTWIFPETQTRRHKHDMKLNLCFQYKHVTETAMEGTVVGSSMSHNVTWRI